MCALAIAEGAMDDAREYAKTRIAFGNPISKYQLILERLEKYWAWYGGLVEIRLEMCLDDSKQNSLY